MSKHILIINNNLNTGGSEVIMQTLVRHLVQRGNDLTVWASAGSREQMKESFPASVHFRRYPFWDVPCKRFTPRWFYTRFCRVLFEKFLLRLRKWDCVVAFKEGESMILASKLRAKRRLGWVHTDYSVFHWTPYCFNYDNEAERQCMAGFDCIVAVSEAAASSLKATLGELPNVRTLFSPVNYRSIEEKAMLLSPEKPADKTLFVSVGRLSEVKRYDMLIDICNELSADFPLEVWIVGGGELEAELREKLQAEGITCVKLLGQKKNPYPYIACADWLVSSSRSESYGLTVQEALILGVPVIASHCPAIEESLDKRFGIVSASDRESLKAAMRSVLADKSKSLACRRAIAKDFNKDALWDKRLDAISELIEQ